ncbi:MAG: hypothetical protein ACLQVI_25895 [Polyangiaceae bacterium]|jgi:hypothetical protein
MPDEEQKPPPQPQKAGAGDKDEGEEEELDEGKTSPFGWLSVLIIVALVVGTWFLIQRLTADANMQDCVQSGRKNCAPIDDTGR